MPRVLDEVPPLSYATWRPFCVAGRPVSFVLYVLEVDIALMHKLKFSDLIYVPSVMDFVRNVLGFQAFFRLTKPLISLWCSAISAVKGFAAA